MVERTERHVGFGVALGALALALAPLVGAADPPERMNYQGVLRDSAGTPITGARDMVFRLFDDPVAAGAEHEVLVDAHAQVEVANGLFGVLLGANAIDGTAPGNHGTLSRAFADFAELYLQVEVAGETLSPRVPIVAAAYALNSRLVRGRELVSDGPLTLFVNGNPTGCDGSGCSDDNDGLAASRAKRTVQAAVDAIPPILADDVSILIADGTYEERVRIWPHTRIGGTHWIRLIGNEAFPSEVSLDGQNLDPPGPDEVESGLFVSDVPVEVVGLTIENHASDGLAAVFSSFVKMSRCLLRGNAGAGAAAVEGGNIELDHTVISNNQRGMLADNGSHIHAGGFVEISDSTGRGVQLYGASIVRFGEAPCTIRNNDLVPEEHSTVAGFGQCVVENSTCAPIGSSGTGTCRP